MDPTPLQIREACEAIQRVWSDDERQRRRVGLMPGHRHACGEVIVRSVIPAIPLDAETAAALHVAS